MITIEEKILGAFLLSMENMQALNKDQLKLIHELASPEALQTCARQLQRLSDELKEYEGKYQVGTMTELGLIIGIKKDLQTAKILEVQVRTDTGKKHLTLEELEEAIRKQPIISVVKE